jgi:hypothetical protein
MDENRIKEIIRAEISKPSRAPLSTPLDIDTIFALKNGGLLTSGSVTLVSGAATVTDRRIRTTSVPLLTYKTHSTPGTLRAVCTDGTLTITSSNGSDASEVHYLIIF